MYFRNYSNLLFPEDTTTVYRDYIYGLEKLTAYVANEGHMHAMNASYARITECATVSRAEGAVFKQKVHFECRSTIRGRYVYIKATGSPHRWTRVFHAVLCEVYVF
jgi:hypothetical protein